MRPYEFLCLATDPELNPKHPISLCSKTSFYKNHHKYKTISVLPLINDSGIKVGAPQMISDIRLHLLKKYIYTTIGFAKKIEFGR